MRGEKNTDLEGRVPQRSSEVRSYTEEKTDLEGRVPQKLRSMVLRGEKLRVTPYLRAPPCNPFFLSSPPKPRTPPQPPRTRFSTEMPLRNKPETAPAATKANRTPGWSYVYHKCRCARFRRYPLSIPRNCCAGELVPATGIAAKFPLSLPC